MKAFENLGFKRGKGKRGFTLIELLIVMVILAILAGVVVMAVGGIFGTAKEQAYNTIKPQIQNAVTAWMVDHNGERPYRTTVNWTVTTEAGDTVDNCSAIDICCIVGTGELLRTVPDGCFGNESVDTSNFWNASDGGYTGCTNPNSGEGHYVWVIDKTGNVYSICDMSKDGTFAGTDLVDGFHNETTYDQDYWP